MQITSDVYSYTDQLIESRKDKKLFVDTTAVSPEQKQAVNTQKQGSGDTVTLSEEAHKLSKESRDSESTPVNASGIAGQDSEEASAPDSVEQIRKQIEEVKKQLQEAKTRLAQAQAKASNSAPSAEPGEDPSEAAMKTATADISGSAEVEAIQAEIGLLNQQLVMLNEQLLEAME